jgi:hypothetical protein
MKLPRPEGRGFCLEAVLRTPVRKMKLPAASGRGIENLINIFIWLPLTLKTNLPILLS